MSDRDATAIAEWVTKYGWLAKGSVFAVIGLLGIEIARTGFADEQADQTGALVTIAEAPVGRLLVLAVGFGLALFAVWQLWGAAVADGDSPLDLARRVASLGLAAAYAMVAATALQIAIGGPADQRSGDDGPTSPDGFTALVLGWAGGRLIVIVIGLGTIIVAGYQLWKALSGRFLDDIDQRDLSARHRFALALVGGAGFIARSAMLVISGALFVIAAWRFDPDEAAGLDQALRTLVSLPGGRWLVGVTSLGLLAAGVYDGVTYDRQRLDD